MEIDAQPAPTVFFRPAESSDLERIVGLEVGFRIKTYISQLQFNCVS